MERSKVVLTTKDVANLFKVEPITVFLWRQGTKRRKPLPSFSVPRGTKGKAGVRFDLREILQWARENHVWVDDNATAGTEIRAA